MRKLLIVEDDPNLRLLYSKEFEEEGYRTRTVASGEEALERLRAEDTDVMILDVRLDGMSGLEVLRRALAAHPRVAIVLNSAYSIFKTDFASWSADRYVIKSSDLTELKHAVRECLAERAQHRAA